MTPIAGLWPRDGPTRLTRAARRSGLVRVDFANGVDAADGTTLTVRTLNQTGTIYTRKGYDDVTGIGSPNGVRYLNKVTAPARHSGR
jgi:hypothetical protein